MTDQEDKEIERLTEVVANQTRAMRIYRAKIADLKNAARAAVGESEHVIMRLKQQLAESVRLHPMRELPEQGKNVIAFIRDGKHFHAYQGRDNVFVYWNERSDSWDSCASLDFVGWIDPMEVVKAAT